MLKSEISGLPTLQAIRPAPSAASNDNINLHGHTSTVLVVDDDELLARLLREVFGEAGFSVKTASSVAEALAQIEACAPQYAVLDMKLPDGTGLEVVAYLHKRQPSARAIILTGYGCIPDAVQAAKLGAIDFLQKPVDSAVLLSVLMGRPEALGSSSAKVMSAARKRWEHIQSVFRNCGGSVSETARRLHMHRRSLQRILSKNAPR